MHKQIVVTLNEVKGLVTYCKYEILRYAQNDKKDRNSIYATGSMSLILILVPVFPVGLLLNKDKIKDLALTEILIPFLQP